jgi:exo-beta-1,3-glucanase (GH17 family)
VADNLRNPLDYSVNRLSSLPLALITSALVAGCLHDDPTAPSTGTAPNAGPATGSENADGPGTGAGDDVVVAPEEPEPTATVVRISGLNFGPYMGNQDPNRGSIIPESQIQQRLRSISDYTKCIRTFGTSSGLDQIPRIARDLGLCVAAGAWLDGNEATNDLEIERLIDIALAGYADYIVVGSEAILRGDLSVQELIAHMERVRQAVPGVPITTGEIYPNWLDHPELVAASDVLFVNYYPYWEGISIDSALAAIQSYHLDVIVDSAGKEVIVSETGWPSCGDTVANAVPSNENAALFFREVVSWAEANNVMTFYFEAFDEPWKEIYEGPQGACWGIWDEAGELKPGMLATFQGERSEDTWSGGEEIPGGLGEPEITFTFVPEIDTFDNLQGRVLHVRPSEYAIVVYIHITSWWVKPYSNRKLTPLSFDGSFIVDITTGGVDQRANEIHAFLVPRDYDPPNLLGARSLPAELFENSIADLSVRRP